MDVINAAAAAKVSALTAFSCIVETNVTFALFVSDPVALSVTDAKVIKLEVTASDPVADS
jgi:hypothetical protein